MFIFYFILMFFKVLRAGTSPEPVVAAMISLACGGEDPLINLTRNSHLDAHECIHTEDCFRIGSAPCSLGSRLLASYGCGR